MSENKKQSEGQVSEAASMDPDALDQPISDDQGVAGNPDQPHDADGEGVEAGPNAKPRANQESAREA
ncbi:hypothetical protein [Nocardioides deserti]|uniref:Nucleotide exchange factor GrpE n=1 Tax=Nocardioides deserti TaxID=1588644 RepID=A0ABR6U7L3_9ACTN|nr:hypothetical protein [Nocardioides deserti]MBC2960365.1 hypothetical protein [Nocardioides deserti]GGO71609.1 hypothetical protein GCM10012276_12980 [Nocardioides deserti]